MDMKKIEEIKLNVRLGLRTKSELKNCGCSECMEALRQLKTIG